MKEKIEKMLAELSERLENANKELSTCPEGTLSYVKRGGTGTFFQIINFGGKRLRKSINKAPDFIRGLARKEYLIKEKKLLEKNIKVLKDAMKTLVEPSPDNVLKSISKHLQGIPEHYFFPQQNKDCWANQPYEMSDYRPEEKKHTTSRGLKVRSKSEVLIAEMLYIFNIQFRYEQVIRINGIVLVPDFTIKLPDGRVFYWEHCGLMSSKEYREHQKWKIEVYEKAGIVPWKNLIMTYDDEDGNINVGIIESEIKNKLMV